MARPLTDYELERARAWLLALRGDTSQIDLVDDINRVLQGEWRITRDRYSKYETGSVDFGRGVLEHFIAYWAKKGRPGPDMAPPPPVVALDPYEVMSRHADAMQAQAVAFNRLAESIDKAANGVIGRVVDFEHVLATLLEAVRPPARVEDGPNGAGAPAGQ